MALSRLPGHSLLTRYVQLGTLRAFTLVAVTLDCLFSLLEFVDQLASVGEGHYHVRDAFIYVVLTAPGRLLKVIPISMLLGALLALGALARNAELTAMLSLGVAERRVIGAVLLLTLPVAALLFALSEYVIPPAQQLAHARREAALSAPENPQADDRVWVHAGREYLHVERFAALGEPVGIDIYAFAADGSLDRLVHAERARPQPDGTWTLLGVRVRRVADGRFTTDSLASSDWRPFVSPRQLRLLALPVDSIPPSVLYAQVFSGGDRQDVTRYDREFWAKADLPLSVVAMVMMAAPFVFGRVRTQSTGVRLAYGVGFGIVFSLVQQIIDHLGLLLRVSPAVTATGPSFGVIALALYLLRDVYWPGLAHSPVPHSTAG